MNIDYILYHSMTSLQKSKQKYKFLNVNEYIPNGNFYTSQQNTRTPNYLGLYENSVYTNH